MFSVEIARFGRGVMVRQPNQHRSGWHKTIFLVEYTWKMFSLGHFRIEIDTSLSVLFVSPQPLGEAAPPARLIVRQTKPSVRFPCNATLSKPVPE
jgi:hypothetical protein